MNDPKYDVGDPVQFFDDAELGTVQVVLAAGPEELGVGQQHHYLVKFSETVDDQWPGFVYPERWLKSPASMS